MATVLSRKGIKNILPHRFFMLFLTGAIHGKGNNLAAKLAFPIGSFY